MSIGYYDESYPPNLIWASGANAGTPGTWTPAGKRPPESPQDLSQGYPLTVTPNPATAWTTGQYVQTGTPGTAGRATWSGTSWVGGVAPLEGEKESFAAIPVDKRRKE